MNDDNNNFCPEHGARGVKICNNDANLKEMKKDLDKMDERFNERIVGLENHDTKTHGEIFKKIDQRLTIRMFGLILSAGILILVGVIGFQTTLIFKHQKAQQTTANGIKTELRSVALSMAGMKSDIGHLASDVSKLEQRVK